MPNIVLRARARKMLTIIFMVGFSLSAIGAFGQTIQTVTGDSAFAAVENGINGAISTVVSSMQSQAILWLSSFVMLQFLITQLSLLKSGAEIEAIFGKLIGSLMWFGVCFYLVENGAKYVNDVGSSFFSIAGKIIQGDKLNAALLMNQGIAIGANIISTINKVAGITDVAAIILGGICGLFVLVVMGYIACKVFVMKIELALVVMVSPMSFSFLGLNALKDQGIAPLKSLISLLYRIVFLAVIISAITTITDSVSKSLQSIYSNASLWTKVTGVGNGVWPAILAIAAAYAIFGYLAYKSDSVAASLASGGTNLGTADIATAAAVGAAAGAAAVTGGAAAAGAASSTGQSMGDFLKGMLSSDVSMKDVSPSGAGPSGDGPPPPKPPSFSAGAGQSNENRPPVRSSGGAPERAPSGGKAASGEKGSSSDGPKRDGNTNNSKGPVPPDSGANAGIEGGGAKGLEEKLADLVDALSQPKEKGVRDHLSELNDHIAREQASTHVSINPHHHD